MAEFKGDGPSNQAGVEFVDSTDLPCNSTGLLSVMSDALVSMQTALMEKLKNMAPGHFSEFDLVALILQLSC